MLHALIFQLLLKLVGDGTLMRFAADGVELLHGFFDRGLCGQFSRHRGALVCGVAGLALDYEQGVTGGFVCRGIAQQYVVDAVQVVVLCQHQQAGSHALAGFVERAAVLCIQRGYAFAHLLVEGVIGMLRLGRQQGGGWRFEFALGRCA